MNAPSARPTVRFIVVLALLGSLLVTVSPAGATPGRTADDPHLTIPAPGSATASPETTIQVDSSSPIDLEVTGSVSGALDGTLTPVAGTTKWTFRPATSFRAGETVRVTSSGRPGLDASFSVGVPAPHPGIQLDEDEEAATASPASAEPADSTDVHEFVTRPDLHPTRVTVTLDAAATAPGLVFASPSRNSTAGSDGGILIYDDDGAPVWFHPEPDVDLAANPTVATLGGRDVLTWFRGDAPYGPGNYRGEWVVVDTSYREIATIRMGNGYQADVHDIELTPHGTAYLMAYSPLSCTGQAPLDHCTEGSTVLEAVLQEVDVASGTVLWEWHSLDHVPLTDSLAPTSSSPFDYIHANSVASDLDGNVLLSGRRTSALYKIDRSTGEIIWTFGGTSSSFDEQVFDDPDDQPGPDYPHHLRAIGPDAYSYFDNGVVRGESRGAVFTVDADAGSVTYEQTMYHDPALLAPTQGSTQELAGGGFFVSWGGLGYATEFNAAGTPIFETDLNVGGSYRQFRQEWEGAPADAPRAVAEASVAGTDVYVSWNGDTATTTWRVVGGPTPDDLTAVGTATRDGFETKIELPDPVVWLAVEALDDGDNVIGRSAVVNGDKWFRETSWPAVGGTYQPIVGDFGGTRNDDVFYYRPGSAVEYLHVSDGAGGFVSEPTPNVGGTYTVIVADVVGDDRDEIIWAASGRATGYLWRFDLAPRSSSPVVASGSFGLPPSFTQGVVLDHRADYGGRIHDEILWYQVGAGADRVDRFTWPSTGFHRVSRPISVNGDFQPIAGDFNGDGLGDVFWYRPGPGQDYTWVSIGGTAGTTGHVSTKVQSAGDHDVYVGNFDGNASRDELLFISDSSEDHLWRFEANGTLTEDDVSDPLAVGVRHVLAGPTDRLMSWVPGSAPRILTVAGAVPVSRSSGNTPLGSPYVPLVGNMAGPGDTDSVLWYAPGPDPEILFLGR